MYCIIRSACNNNNLAHSVVNHRPLRRPSLRYSSVQIRQVGTVLSCTSHKELAPFAAHGQLAHICSRTSAVLLRYESFDPATTRREWTTVAVFQSVLDH